MGEGAFCTHAMACMWILGDNFMELVPSMMWVPGIQPRLSILTANTFTR